MKKKILLTGGGSAGHVMPNMALLPGLIDAGFEIHYIGTADGIERELMEDCENVIYHVISSGKLRRYFSWRNFTDPFKVIKGVFQSKRIIKEIKPAVVFSKGGFVSVPVVIAAHKKAPVIAHESDYTPGLANRISAKFADRVCVSFEDTLQFVGDKGVYTGSPIRPELLHGDPAQGRRFLGFSDSKPVLLVMGGSLGAAAINEALTGALPKLLPVFNVVHLCGKGKCNPSVAYDGYVQREFIGGEMKDVFACTELVISRAGANAVFELLALKKPAVFIPLPRSASRGDQILNAAYFERKGYAMVVEQERLTADTLVTAVTALYANREKFRDAIAKDPASNGTERVMEIILGAAGDR